MAIFTHIVLGTNDLERARKFYDQTLSALGVKRVMNMDNASLWGTEGRNSWSPSPPTDSLRRMRMAVRSVSRRPTAPRCMRSTRRRSPPAAPAKALRVPRSFTPTAYAAYVRDPDGNKLTAYTFVPG